MNTSSPSLKGKTALVTGGTTGIGRATAKLLSEAGVQVMIFGRHQQELDDALQDVGHGAFGIVADQSDGDEIAKVFREVDNRLGGLDILINNAAISADSVTDADYDQILYAVRSNLVAYMECARLAIERMKTKGSGDIVNIGSMSAVERSAGSDIYTATKTGIDGFTDSLRHQVVDDGIRVSLIEPGLVGTDMTADDHPPAEQRKMEAKGEMLTAEDIARCVLFVVGQPARCDVIHIRVQPHADAKE